MLNQPSEEKKKKVVIIGAGPGGLAAGLLLANKKFEVTIIEKEDIPGGRNGCLKLGDYKFDIGPTFFMMSYVLEEIFRATGRKLTDYVEMTRLEPMYRLHFADKYLDVYQDREKMKQELERVFPGQGPGLDEFYRREKKRLDHLYPILSADNNSLSKIFSFNFLKALSYFSVGRSIFQVLGRYFSDESARLCFTFQSKYLGMSPWECPGAFAMVPYVEHEMGIYHLTGGLSEAAVAMAKAASEDGAKIRYRTKAEKIIFDGKKAVGVKLTSGEEIMADKVIVNADFSYAARHLFPEGLLKKYSPKKLDRKKYSCSIFMLYLGINRRLNLRHHTIVFAKDYKNNVKDIFGGKLTGNDFSFYVRDASKVDPTLAPSGKTALYVLVPVPNNRGQIDWTEKSKAIRDEVIKLISQRLNIDDLNQYIEQEKIINPADWEKDYNVDIGAVFNLSHHLDQMLFFRPHNRFEEVKNVYLVGGGTHPGSGLPTIYESGRIAARLICEDFKINFK